VKAFIRNIKSLLEKKGGRGIFALEKRGTRRQFFAFLLTFAFIGGGFAAGVGVVQRIRRDIPARNGAIYYQGGIAYYKSANRKNPNTLRFTSGGASVVSTNGKVWWFTAPAVGSEENLYDLYYMESGKKPILRQHGINNWLIGNADGSMVLFKKRGASGAEELICLTDKGRKSQKLAENVEEIWLPNYGNEFWYSKTQHGTKTLWRVNLHGEELRLENNVDYVTLAQNGRKTTPQLLYLRKDKNVLCLLNQGSDMVMEIADGVDSENLSAFLLEYTPGANLYFFRQRGDTPTSWRDVFKDSLADSDAEMKEPKREDHFNIFGLWAPAYDRARQEYEEKLTRDRLRHALDELGKDKKLFPSSRVLHVWDGKAVSELCSIAKEDILAKRMYGAPGIAAALREPQTMNADIAGYAVRAKKEDIEVLIKEARNEITAAIGVERLCLVVPSTKGTQFEGLASEYRRKDTSFAFSRDGTSLYGIVERKIKQAEGTVVRQDIYVQEIEGRVLSPRRTVQIDAQQTQLIGNSIWCVLPNADGKALGDLHRIHKGKKVIAAEYVLNYEGDEESGIIIYHHPVALESGSAPQSRLSFWQKGKTIQIDPDNVMFTESVHSLGRGAILYLVPQVGKAGGTLKLWKNGKSLVLSKEAEKVLVF